MVGKLVVIVEDVLIEYLVKITASRAKILLWLSFEAGKVDLGNARDWRGRHLLRDAWLVLYLILKVDLVGSGIQAVRSLDEEIEERLLILLSFGSGLMLAVIDLCTLGLREYALSMLSIE